MPWGVTPVRSRTAQGASDACAALVDELLAKPVAAWIFSGFSVKTQENIAMLAGMCIFVGMNYLGQRFVVFREEKSE